MSDESAVGVNPISAALAELRARRDELDRLIQGLEKLEGGGGSAAPVTLSFGSGPIAEIPHNFFHGTSIHEGAKKLLNFRSKDLSNKQIAADFKAGGLVMKSDNPENTINSVLTRRFQQVGDIVKVGRGVWGLKEWHPTIRAPKGERESDKKGDDEDAL